MDSAPTSSLRFCDRAGQPLAGPPEWRPALLEILVPVEHWHAVSVTVNGRPLEIYQRRQEGQHRLVADWDAAGAGHYRLRLEAPAAREERLFTVYPEKISQESFAALLDDLQRRLPATIAIALQRGGALAGLEFRSPDEITLAEEVERLRVAVHGRSDRLGLVEVLARVSANPHRVGISTSLWTRKHRVRRPTPNAIICSLRVPGNIDGDGSLARVYDARSELSADTYENQLIKSYLHQVEQRLRDVHRVLLAAGNAAAGETAELLAAMQRARSQARFLDEVSLPHAVPQRLTMVLLKVAPYRAALEGLIEFNRLKTVLLNNSALEAPLENLPYLYELRGSLIVLDAVLRVAAELGYVVREQRLGARKEGSIYISLMAGRQPLARLEHPGSKVRVQLFAQQPYGNATHMARSLSFSQIPDVSLWVERPAEPPALYIFDSKYKLDSEGDAEGGARNGRPKKADIDKMHAYRDAIRDHHGDPVVRYAATLYPGPTVSYFEGLEALQDYPGKAAELESHLIARVRRWLLSPL